MTAERIGCFAAHAAGIALAGGLPQTAQAKMDIHDCITSGWIGCAERKIAPAPLQPVVQEPAAVTLAKWTGFQGSIKVRR